MNVTHAGRLVLSAEPTWAQAIDTWVGLGSAVVTAAAVIIGGWWAYWKFGKNRTYRPRLGVSISGAWVTTVGARRLHLTVAVKNIGASVVTLLQEGTSLDLQTMREHAGIDAFWSEPRSIPVLVDHQWIEPGETVTDDLIAPIEWVDRPVRVCTLLVWKWTGGGAKNIVVRSHVIVWPHDVEPAAAPADPPKEVQPHGNRGVVPVERRPQRDGEDRRAQTQGGGTPEEG